MTKPLKLYKASAGSGKTFTLAVEYIKLLVQRPDEYKHILAVTFTNKATAEMKNRILSKLYGIANSLPDGEPYLDAIKSDPKFKSATYTDDFIRRQCADALNRIIHDYSRFRIETIDSFFQSVIRDLTRELDLTANLRVDLNAEEVLNEAVDTIIEELDRRTDVLDSISRFVEEKIESGANWQINKEVATFGKNIFKEDYLRNQEVITKSIQDPVKLRKYKSDLHRLKDASLNHIKELGEGFFSEMSAHGLSMSDINKGEQVVGSYIRKLIDGKKIDPPSDTFLKYATDVDAMCKKTTKADIRQTLAAYIVPFLTNLVNRELPIVFSTINTVNAISCHLNHLMLLNVINDEVRALNKDANRFLLADSAHFLNDIIDGSDVPFIYEKSGTWFEHIMIDEFQDTSALQWENFKPLIQNSMSNQMSCLIVGDVKQSIYRWRDSDWQILNNRIKDEFPRDLDDDSLKTNFRSAGRIVHFNNQFFNKAVHLINNEYKAVHNTDSADLLKAYSDVRQLVKPDNEGMGYVYVDNFVSSDYTADTPQRILETVKRLNEQGIGWNDMTILVRANKAIPTLCQYFYDHYDEIGTNIVSDEAFRLDSSSAINLIIFALIAISNPKSSFNLRNLAVHYQMAQKGDVNFKNEADRIFQSSDEGLSQYLPEGFREKMSAYAFTPLHELIEQLYEVLGLKSIKNQDAYLFYFHDLISEYVQDNQTDIDSFLTYWNEKMCMKTIPNGASDGIRIMSIHKSKGLEFHTVIVPYCDWKVNEHGTLLWCEPTQEPFNELPFVPVNYESRLETSIFNNYYSDELLKNNVDNLNLIYVAFTRASKNLVVLTGAAPVKNPTNSLTTIQKVIVASMQELMRKDNASSLSDEPSIDLQVEEDGESSIWTLGEPVPSETKKGEKKTDNVLEQPSADITTNFIHEAANIQFRQSNDSEDFIFGKDEDTPSGSDDYIERGNVYHRIFELIKTPDDVDRVIDQLDGEGRFENVMSVDEARTNIKNALSDPLALHWFDPGWREFKECSIMSRDKEGRLKECRPDRVIMNDRETIVIDYKSGEEEPRHILQVRNYMYLLKQMGYKNIKGYIWYFMHEDTIPDLFVKGGGKIVEVKLNTRSKTSR